MEIIRQISFLALVLMMLAGCGGSFDRPRDEEKIKQKPQPEMAYEPLGMPEDYKIIPAEYPLIAVADSVTDSGSIAADLIIDSTMSNSDSHESYRIQIFTSNTYGPAARELNIAREVFDQKVHLDYEVPYYKVRVGDFAHREEAEKYLPAAKEAGYGTAWVVKVTINIETLEDIYEKDNFPPLIDSADLNMMAPEPAYDFPENSEN